MHAPRTLAVLAATTMLVTLAACAPNDAKAPAGSTGPATLTVDSMPAAQEVLVDPEVGLHVRPRLR